MTDVRVISLGGSIVAPDRVDVPFLKRFHALVSRYLAADRGRKLILVVGGGAPARSYQKAYREIVASSLDSEADWIGVAATRLNAQLLAGVFSQYCKDPVVTDPTTFRDFNGQVLIAAGWKPGFSTDYDAVLLAEKFGADTIVNLSNIAQVFTADPKVDPSARPLDRITWADFRKLVGDRWEPGKNTPFDPIASKKASQLGLRVIVASGREVENLQDILADSDFLGTVIGPG